LGLLSGKERGGGGGWSLGPRSDVSIKKLHQAALKRSKAMGGREEESTHKKKGRKERPISLFLPKGYGRDLIREKWVG